MMKIQSKLDYKVIAVIDALEHYFKQSKYRDGFCMFHTLPGQTNDYDNMRFGTPEPGLSWQDEVGLSHHMFNKLFDIVGIRYRSKTQYRAQADPFQGKLYVSYYDRQMRRTFYKRNQTVADQYLTVKGRKQSFQNIVGEIEHRFMVG